ncbi:aminodeoxychorismate lyase [Synergistales bacterium]|nr:aminodeoxychorismate lyase [Synergistales bacterium]
MKKKKFYFKLIISLLAVAIISAGAAYFALREKAPAKLGGEVEVFIQDGWGAGAAAREFERLGIVSDGRVLVKYIVQIGIERKIKPGKYKIRAGYAENVARELAAASPEVRMIRILPGALLDDIKASLGDNGASLTAALSDDKNFPEDSRVLLPAKAADRITMLAPETYSILPDGKDAERLVTAAAALWWKQRRDTLPNDITSADILRNGILASIIEKEALVSADRPMMAGVFKNRLGAGMPLQSCATVVYAWKTRGVKIERVNFNDIKINSPFNTYIHDGLPPGNIGVPSVGSWSAALSPASTDMLFFVAKGDGGHVFTRTYSEHLAAKNKIDRESKGKPNK